MMNTKRSSLRQSWKYLLFIPILGIAILIFNPSGLSAIPEKEKPEYLGVFISANSSKKDLKRIQTQMSDFGYALNYHNLTWDKRGHIKTISANLSTYAGNVTNTVTFSDINRHRTINMFHFKSSVAGIFGEGGIKDDGMSFGIVDVLPDRDFSEIIDSIYIVTTMSPHLMTAQEFLTSTEWQDHQTYFANESEWSNQFNEDMTNGTNHFNYVLDDKKINSTELARQYQLRDIRDVEITDTGSGNPIFKIFSAPFTGFKLRKSSSFPKRKDHAQLIKSINDAIAKFKEESPESAIKYFYEGLSTEFTHETIGANPYSLVSVKAGNNFDNHGNFLGKEIRVYIKN